MRIKKLELLGFKSFKDKTVIQFDPGTTGIVGPNGCGKSNIVDALVWVMGEMSAKHLRGSSMSDVIFAGSQDYAPMGMAEVSLTLENDGGPFPAKYSKHSEVMITRRLHRSGESEYLINKEPARLRDIQEIFMDTGAGAKGFSIIEQGAIGKIITAKPIDRRTLIEEAAGITKFKVRKRESVRKLKSTEQNLVRLQDIIGEQKRQLGSLERQAQRAERYRKIKNELQEKDLLLSSKKYLEITDQLNEAEVIYKEASESEVGTASNIDQLESELENLKLQLVEKEKSVESKQISAGEARKTVQELEYEIRELKFEIEQAKRDSEKTGSIVEQYQVRRQALRKDFEELSEKLTGLTEESEKLQSRYLERNEYFQNIHARAEEADRELTVARKELITRSQADSHIEAQILSKQTYRETVVERLEQSRLVSDELLTKTNEFEAIRNKTFSKLENQKQMQLGIMNDVENFKENLKSVEEQYEKKLVEVEHFKKELNEVSGKLYGLENLQDNYEGFEKGVKSVMLWQRQQQEAHADGSIAFRPVSEVVEVPEKYEMAMEAALGQRLQMLLSDSSDSSLGALDYLKENRSGRSSFVNRDMAVVGDSSSLEQLRGEEGVDSVLKDVVSVPEEYNAQITMFLNDIVIVDSIRSALRLRSLYAGKTFVTLEGDSLTADGVLSGGSAEGADAGVLQRKREIKELSQKREEWAGKLSLAQVSLNKLDEQRTQLEAQLEKARTQQSEQEIQVVELKKDLERAENELTNTQRALDKQNNEINAIEAQLNQLDDAIAEMESSKQEILQAKIELEQKVDALTEELFVAKNGVGDLQEEVTQLKVEAASKGQELEGVRSQYEMVGKSLRDVEEQLGQMSEDAQKSTESLSSNSILIEEKQVQLEQYILLAEQSEKALSIEKDEYEKLYEGTRAIEERVSTSNRALNEYKSRINEAQLKVEQLHMKAQYVVDQVLERYHVELSEKAEAHRDVEVDLKELESEVGELRDKINRIGEVNLSAIEEYDELSERYKFLSQQHNDLTEAKEQLRKVIDRINRICSRRFKETFDLVNERFQKVFPVLFGGGEAKLILVENEEKGEMGIDIVAKPPGKKPQNVGLLSGGEKALTAVSLIFSIFLVKPSPFCLLDEVDAPLDDANVMRFNDLVKEMAKRSQIIIVTHNKHTMKVNKKLYGVTQEERGVSKMVSVALDQAESFADRALTS
ncbi:MAG: chromosome segregation protein SMC [Bdellovibrionales bacterium]